MINKFSCQTEIRFLCFTHLCQFNKNILHKVDVGLYKYIQQNPAGVSSVPISEPSAQY